MAVFRVEKNKDYTTMSNYHLRDKNLSLKAKGLLSMCLSLTDSWDYSINGLASISKEGRDAILSAVHELEKAGYIVRNRTRDEHGRLRGNEYSIYEYPQKPETDSPASGSPMLDSPTSENPTQDIPTLEKPAQENPRQLNTNKSNTEIINNGDKEREKDKEKEQRHRYGEYQNVLLSDDEMERLKEDYPQDYQQRIERLSEYIASTGKSYKSHQERVCQDDFWFFLNSRMHNMESNGLALNFLSILATSLSFVCR